jgi:hypothetical protein
MTMLNILIWIHLNIIIQDGILSNYYLDLQSKVIKLVDTNGGYN